MYFLSAFLVSGGAIVPVICSVAAAVCAAICCVISLVLIFRRNKAKQEPEGDIIGSEPEPVPAEEAEGPVTEAAEEPVCETEEQSAQQPVPETEAERKTEDRPVEAVQNTAERPIAAPAPLTSDEPIPEAAKVVFVSANRLVSVRYDKSFTAKLIQTSQTNKEYYSAIKNELLRYRRVKARTSWRQESFRVGRALVAKLEMRGKTLCLYLALDPARYAESKYLVEDASDTKKNAAVPCMYRIKNDRRARYAPDLIADLFRDTESTYRESEPIDYASQFPYDDTMHLVERELVKIVEARTGTVSDEDEEEYYEESEVRDNGVSVDEAEREMRDEEAEKLVRESGNVSMHGRQTIVNVDTLGEYFSDGETVTLEDMKERIPFLNKSATYVKVLARGRLGKSLVVEADDYSLAAVKMIVLAGGTVYRKRTD